MTRSLHDRGTYGRLLAHLVYFTAALYKIVVLQVRYPANTLGRFLIVYGMFAGVFFGGTAIAGERFTDSLDAIVVGYFLWTMAVAAYVGVADEFTAEAQWGTLEQLYMSPLGFGRVTAAKVVVSIVDAFLWGAAILLVMSLTTGRWFHVDPFTVVPLLLLTLATAVGVGFVMGGLALLYKRIENFTLLVQFLLLGFIATPLETHRLAALLPLTFGSHLLGEAMVEGIRLWEFPPFDLALLVGLAVGYLVVGYAVCARCIDRAREKGVLGHY